MTHFGLVLRYAILQNRLAIGNVYSLIISMFQKLYIVSISPITLYYNTFIQITDHIIYL